MSNTSTVTSTTLGPQSVEQNPISYVPTTQSESLGDLALALSKAQGAMTAAKKDKSNPFFKSNYSDLASVWGTIREPLTKNDLAVVQTTSFECLGNENVVVLKTLLTHKSGQWISSTYPVLPVKKDPQGYGSAMSYARRYTLMAITGVASADDDGEAAMNRSAPKTKVVTPVKKKTDKERVMDAFEKLNVPEDYRGSFLTVYEKDLGFLLTKLTAVHKGQVTIDELHDVAMNKYFEGKQSA